MSFVASGECDVCGGSLLNPKALATKINGYNIVDYMDMPVSDLAPIINNIKDACGLSLGKQILEYLKRMINVGISHLLLSRENDTLSGGELRCIKIVCNLCSSQFFLQNICY